MVIRTESTPAIQKRVIRCVNEVEAVMTYQCRGLRVHPLHFLTGHIHQASRLPRNIQASRFSLTWVSHGSIVGSVKTRHMHVIQLCAPKVMI